MTIETVGGRNNNGFEDDDLTDLINSGDLLGGGNGQSEEAAIEGRDVTLASSALPFSPDEEDVENQLMHIDDQLIRLDGSIDNIEQVRTDFFSYLENTSTASECDLEYGLPI